MTNSENEARPATWPQDIIDDANSRDPWPSPAARAWYMEGRLIERQSSGQTASD